MKTIREIELEIELAKTRQQVVHLSMLKMRGDMSALEKEIDSLNAELLGRKSVADRKKLTQEQALIITGYTGVLACSESAIKSDIEKRLGGQIGYITLAHLGEEKISTLYKDDYVKLCPRKHPESETKLTEEQAIIVTGYTGKITGDEGKFYADLEKRLGRKIVNSEIPSIGQEKISSLYKQDFQSLAR